MNAQPRGINTQQRKNIRSNSKLKTGAEIDLRPERCTQAAESVREKIYTCRKLEFEKGRKYWSEEDSIN